MISEIEAMLASEEAYKLAKRAYDMARVNAQVACDHKKVVETKFSSDDGNVPYRVCKDCGYGEDGWDYTFLKGDVEEVDREIALSFVKGYVLNHSQHKNARGKKNKLRRILNEICFL